MEPPADVSKPRLSPAAPLALGVCALGGTYLLPGFSLEGDTVAAASWWTHSGGVAGAPVVAALAAAVYLGRPGLDRLARRREGLALLGALVLLLGLLAAVNEFVTKPAVGAPRPFVRELAAANELGLTPDEFYALGDKQDRRDYLRGLQLQLPEAVRSHWLRETGYSFPSGHSLAAMTLAGCFVALAWRGGLTGIRLLLLLSLVPWAVAVGYTRAVIRVHSPLDVTVGGALGAVTGLAAAALTCRWRGGEASWTSSPTQP